MASSTLSPNLHFFSSPSTPKPRTGLTTRPRFRPKLCVSPASLLSDPFVLQIVEALEDSLSSSSSLQKLRDFSSQTLISTPSRTRKDDPFRFTDTSLIKNSQILPIGPPLKPPQTLEEIPGFLNVVTIVDGHVVGSVSGSTLPGGVFVGGVLSLDSEVITKRVGEFVNCFDLGDLFFSLNGVGAPDLVVVYVPEGCCLEHPLYFRHCSVEGSDVGSKTLPVSSPRVLVVVEEGGEVDIVEEFVGGDGP